MLAGCQAWLALDAYGVSAPDASLDTAVAAESAGCATFADCNRDPDAGPRFARICKQATHSCVPLLSEDCQTVTGDYRNDDAIVIGSMFSTSGAQAAVNRARERSAILAVDEINLAGGIPTGATATALRPLVLVSCDEAQLLRAGAHLVDDLHVPAIVGPNTSQDTLDLSIKLTIPTGTLVMTPTGVASSIADLLDDGLTWQLVPNDEQRMPLMLSALDALAAELRAGERAKELRLAVIYRDDALGQGTSSGLNMLTFNGRTLLDPQNLARAVRIMPYRPDRLSELDLEGLRTFAPDLIVLIGTAEAVTSVMLPLERGWTAPQRPHYMLVDSLKTPELLEAVSELPDLRRRIRGTGAIPAERSTIVNESFIVNYATRYHDEPSNLYGMGPTYDATYAIACAIAALRGAPITGRAIANMLPLLARGGTEIELQSTKTLAAFRLLTEGLPLTLIGTNAPLQWDARGSIASGTIELWCISATAGRPSYASSGLVHDLGSGQLRGQFTQCPP
ncbi:MAG: hypothetical protein ABW321_15665 [Polyangiales bacterium]